MVHSSSVFRRTEALRVGGYPEYSYLEDWALFRALAGVGEVNQEETADVVYRVHPQNTSKRFADSRARMEKPLQAIFSDLPTDSLNAEDAAEARWILFRGRVPFAARPALVDWSLKSLFARCSVVFPETTRKTVRASRFVLRDVVNVLRCRGWTKVRVALVLRELRRHHFPLGLSREFATLILLPMTRNYARV